jgi:hypothetical protein
MRFERTHDGKGFVLYIDTEPPGPHVKSYLKIVLSPNRADALLRALQVYVAEQDKAREETWLPGP